MDLVHFKWQNKRSCVSTSWHICNTESVLQLIREHGTFCSARHPNVLLNLWILGITCPLGVYCKSLAEQTMHLAFKMDWLWHITGISVSICLQGISDYIICLGIILHRILIRRGRKLKPSSSPQINPCLVYIFPPRSSHPIKGLV